MKPAMFLGSSKEGLPIAEAIHNNCHEIAECTCWHQGAFAIATNTLATLINYTTTSDFATFVFAPDDITRTRGEVFFTPRDNVIYELGLFSGAIGHNRCFIALPETIHVKLPSDLAGISCKTYDNARRDGNMLSALGPLCYEIKGRIASLGPLRRPVHDDLRALILQYDLSCNKPLGMVGTSQLDRLFKEMRDQCKSRPPSKFSLIERKSSGSHAAFVAAVMNKLEANDIGILTSENNDFPLAAHSQHLIVDFFGQSAIYDRMTPEQRIIFVMWMKARPNLAPGVSVHLDDLELANLLS